MYSKEGKLVDRRELLRIKLKSLAEEARIIRKEERRTHGILREEMHLHRVRDLRSEARHTHIAYGIIRGRLLEEIERPGSTPFDQARVDSMIKKYGPAAKLSLVKEAA